MSLLDFWKSSKQQIKDKNIQQIIAFTGDGNLRDGSDVSTEFRDYLSHIPSSLLKLYSIQCLEEAFKGSGFVLQDTVNQVGRRLGFKVTDGRYRGTSKHVGFDGLWEYPDGHIIIVEVKTTDAYRIDLETISSYRKSLIKDNTINEANSSTLIVVGRDDTGDLEAQIRGSRYAWDIRLISVDALLRLMSLKEDVEDPQIIKRIYDILIPLEFTKLDEIIDIVFSTAEDVKPRYEPQDQVGEYLVAEAKFTQVAFHDACIARIEKHLSCNLIKRSRASYSTPEENIRIICSVSKKYDRSAHVAYWFAFHPYQKDYLEGSNDSYIAYGCGDEHTLILIPFKEFANFLDDLNITEKEDRFYWHVRITNENGRFYLHRKGRANRAELTKFLLG